MPTIRDLSVRRKSQILRTDSLVRCRQRDAGATLEPFAADLAVGRTDVAAPGLRLLCVLRLRGLRRLHAAGLLLAIGVFFASYAGVGEELARNGP